MYDATVETIPHLFVHPVFRMSTAVCTGTTAFHGQAPFFWFWTSCPNGHLAQWTSTLFWMGCDMHLLLYLIPSSLAVVLSFPDLQRGRLLFSPLGNSLVYQVWGAASYSKEPWLICLGCPLNIPCLRDIAISIASSAMIMSPIPRPLQQDGKSFHKFY